LVIKKENQIRMKNFKFIITLLVVLTGIACSNDDDGTTTPTLSNEKQITGFSFSASENPALADDVTATIDETTQTITAEVPSGTDVTALNPDIEISARASFSPVGEQDFTAPVTYTVTAEDGTTVDYTINITVALSEREILIALYEQNPGNTLEWDISNMDISTWNGVNTNSEGYVTELILQNKNLEALPQEIGQFPYLKVLNLSWNPITTLPPGIGQLTNLKSLNLGLNFLTTLPPEIGQLTNLTDLEAFGNGLISLPPEIGQLSNLTLLDLNLNQLTFVPQEIFQLKKLTVLGLWKNQLTVVPPEISQLSSLTILNLDENQITSIPAEIGQLINLTQLHFGFNEITSVPLEIGQLINLTEMNLYKNQITSVPPEIGNIIDLQDLDLSDNQLASLPPEIGGLHNLRFQYLQNNLLTAIPSEICALETTHGTTIYRDPGLNCGEEYSEAIATIK